MRRFAFELHLLFGGLIAATVYGFLAAAVYVARGEAKDNEESGIRN
ncbi:MAG: hypothetical protein MPW14_10065 [Candidatus Manganitrophus sp.]|nr:hypothetical protein [Candidatus Manganitrophus sp.]WDT70702.1 MAG: hypothetical protein MPW17_18435 [Candidatus Manganitrophus sp.]WDT82032.1 MAG: hypothetical protein MPW14_10065 [Candidatus Manganitrophus sp.]